MEDGVAELQMPQEIEEVSENEFTRLEVATSQINEVLTQSMVGAEIEKPYREKISVYANLDRIHNLVDTKNVAVSDQIRNYLKEIGVDDINSCIKRGYKEAIKLLKLIDGKAVMNRGGISWDGDINQPTETFPRGIGLDGTKVAYQEEVSTQDSYTLVDSKHAYKDNALHFLNEAEACLVVTFDPDLSNEVDVNFSSLRADAVADKTVRQIFVQENFDLSNLKRVTFSDGSLKIGALYRHALENLSAGFSRAESTDLKISEELKSLDSKFHTITSVNNDDIPNRIQQLKDILKPHLNDPINVNDQEAAFRTVGETLNFLTNDVSTMMGGGPLNAIELAFPIKSTDKNKITRMFKRLVGKSLNKAVIGAGKHKHEVDLILTKIPNNLLPKAFKTVISRLAEIGVQPKELPDPYKNKATKIAQRLMEDIYHGNHVTVLIDESGQTVNTHEGRLAKAMNLILGRESVLTLQTQEDIKIIGKDDVVYTVPSRHTEIKRSGSLEHMEAFLSGKRLGFIGPVGNGPMYTPTAWLTHKIPVDPFGATGKMSNKGAQHYRPQGFDFQGFKDFDYGHQSPERQQLYDKFKNIFDINQMRIEKKQVSLTPYGWKNYFKDLFRMSLFGVGIIDMNDIQKIVIRQRDTNITRPFNMAPNSRFSTDSTAWTTS